MRLLINCLSSVSGGAVTYLRNLVPKLAAEIHRLDASVELVLLHHAHQRTFFPPEIKARRVELDARSSTGLRRAAHEALTLKSIVSAERADVVFTPYQAALLPRRTRHVLMLRNMEPFRFRAYSYGFRGAVRNALLEKWSAYCLRRADRVIAVSDYAYACAERELRVSGQRLRMVYHGRDPAFDAPARTHGQAPGETAPLPFPYVLSVGSLLPYRRAEDIIGAFSAYVRPLIPDLHLVFAGDSNERAYKAYLRQKVRESADPDKIRFLGNVPPQSLPSLYRGASCYVASTEIEACPNSVIEALASSCPIVASKAQPLPEILSDSAMFYEPRNVSELGSVIGKVVTDSKLGASLSQSSWERARHFSWDACAKGTAKALLGW